MEPKEPKQPEPKEPEPKEPKNNEPDPEPKPRPDDTAIELDAAKEVIEDLKKSNADLLNEVKSLKKDMAKVALRVGTERPKDDGEIFGVFNKYRKD